MQKNKRAFLIAIMVAVIAVVVFAMPLFFAINPQCTYVVKESDSLYINAINETSQDITIDKTEYNSTTRDFSFGENIALYHTSAIPLALANNDYCFNAHITKTVVIAVDREQTDEKIDSFADVLSTNQQINFDFGARIATNAWEYPQTHQIVTAMAQAVYGEYDIEGLAEDFAKIYNEGRFFVDDMSKPIIVTTDSTAVELIKSGRELEIIIPSDGTLSFDFGALVYCESIVFEDTLSDKLLELGFRLPDGTADERYYPTAEQYLNTSYVADIDEYSLVTTTLSRTFRREAFDTRHYGFANQIETTTFFLPLLLITICYMIGVKRRISDRVIRNQLFVALILLIFFITIGLLKSLNSSSEVIETTLWYLYYLPILFLPALFVKIALHAGHKRISQRVLRAYNVYFVLTFIPLLLVFTNNLHNFIFIVHDYMHSYFTHNVGYYFVMVWVSVSVIFSYELLVYKNITSPRKGAFIYPALLSIALVIYACARAMRVTFFVEFDLTFAVTIMVILYIESCIQSRLFPTNKGYDRFFKHSNLAMEITDNNDKAVYKSLVTQDVNENFIKRSSRISGGRFYYFEDYTAINTAEMKLLAINDEIKKNNEFLLQKQEVKSNLAALSAEKAAYDSIDNILLVGTDKIKRYIEQIASGADRKKLMTAINVCATIMKRDSMYRINALYQDSQPVSILVNSFAEIKDILSSNNIFLTIHCEVFKNLPTATIAVMYAFFASVTLSAIEVHCKDILLQIYEKDGEIVFSALADRELFEKEKLENLPKYKIEYTVVAKDWEDSKIYLLTFKSSDEVQDD